MSKTTRVVLLTDLHLRSDYVPGYLECQLTTLTRLVNQKPTDVVVINGDIFHKRNPRGAELLAFRRLLESFKCSKIYINRGNHDTVAKDGSTDTTLSLYGDIATVFAEVGTAHIGSVDFDFIPHFEDEREIVRAVKSSKNHFFGHFGYDGCVANGNYKYDSYLKAHHFNKDTLHFLGHIHKPQQHKSTYILGTQYSTSFGEANAQKYLHELIIRDGTVEVVKKPIDFGIRHVVSRIDELPLLSSRLRFDSFFTILRLKLDYLDSSTEQALRDDVLAKYSINHLEFAFDDILPKFDSSYNPKSDVFSIDDDVITKYLNEADTVFTTKELLGALSEIQNNED